MKGSFYELFLIILLPPMLFQSAISIEKVVYIYKVFIYTVTPI